MSPGRSHGLKPLRVWRSMSKKSRTVCGSCAKRPMWRWSGKEEGSATRIQGEKKMCGPNVIDDLRMKLQKRRAQKEERRDAEAASGNTMKEPWPKPVGDSQNRRCLQEELFILFLKFRGLRIPGHKEDSVRLPNEPRVTSPQAAVRPPAESPQRGRASPSS